MGKNDDFLERKTFKVKLIEGVENVDKATNSRSIPLKVFI